MRRRFAVETRYPGEELVMTRERSGDAPVVVG
jgi:hypothetical protein